jgi:ABC-2 type transport system permease protein
MPWLTLLKSNLKKEYLELRRYLPNTLAMILTFYIIFLGLFGVIQIIGDPATQDANTQYVIVNYIFWFLAFTIINSMGYEIINEGMRGTLEQLSMSPAGLWKILFARLISTTIINIGIVIVLLFISMATAGEWLNVDFVSLVPIMLFTLISMFGMSYIIAGISIIVKQVQAFLQILQFILMALTFIPITLSPVVPFLPFVKGIDMVRDVMIHGVSLFQFQVADFLLLIGSAVIYFFIGLFVFIYCERVAMDKGLLAHY